MTENKELKDFLVKLSEVTQMIAELKEDEEQEEWKAEIVRLHQHIIAQYELWKSHNFSCYELWKAENPDFNQDFQL
jgi:hypothetical protein